MYYNDYNRFNELSPMAEPPQEPPRKKRSGLRIAALCLVFALLGGVAGGAAVTYLPRVNPDTTTIYEGSHEPVVVGVSNISSDKPLTPAQVYAANVGSTVGITTELVTTNFWGQQVRGAAAGSGFVITSDGYILTNYHVIDGATSIQVAFVDGTTYPAVLVGGEEANDVAVLKIEATGLRPVVLGDSDQLVVGQTVYAIGNPLGELTYTLTDGMVSALDRLITTDESVTMNMLQTNCAINPGNSGGPLFDASGKVIGIVTAKQTRSSSGVSAEGLGFAIPINDVKAILSDLKDFGYVTGRPFLGISGQNISEAIQRYGIPAGAEVVAIGEGSCAQKAGMQVGDIITAVDGTAVDSQSALSALLASEYKAGDTIQVTVVRQQEELTLTVTLDERNEKTEAAIPEVEQNQQGQNGGSYGGYYDWPYGAFPYFW